MACAFFLLLIIISVRTYQMDSGFVHATNNHSIKKIRKKGPRGRRGHRERERERNYQMKQDIETL